MGDADGCPLCAKAVAGRTALLGHLEFSHEIDDPAEFLATRDQPADPRRRRRFRRTPAAPARRTRRSRRSPRARGAHRTRRARRGRRARAPGPEAAPRRRRLALPAWATPSGLAARHPRWWRRVEAWLPRGRAVLLSCALVGVLAVVLVATALGGVGSSDAEVASATEGDAPGGRDGAAAPTAPTDPGAAGKSAATGPTASLAPGLADEVSVEGFRLPFRASGRVASCTRNGDVATYEIEVRFSGARDIVFAGTAYPGRSGDGEHVVDHEHPAGTTGWFDHVELADGAGSTHRVELETPVHLPGC